MLLWCFGITYLQSYFAKTANAAIAAHSYRLKLIVKGPMHQKFMWTKMHKGTSVLYQQNTSNKLRYKYLKVSGGVVVLAERGSCPFDQKANVAAQATFTPTEHPLLIFPTSTIESITITIAMIYLILYILYKLVRYLTSVSTVASVSWSACSTIKSD
eukprot:4006719-Amphidinium_carterae.1